MEWLSYNKITMGTWLVGHWQDNVCLIIALSWEDSWGEGKKRWYIKDKIYRLNQASKKKINKLIVEDKLC